MLLMHLLMLCTNTTFAFGSLLVLCGDICPFAEFGDLTYLEVAYDGESF